MTEISKTKKLIIIGAGGHGKVIADIAALNGYREIVFLDNDPGIKECEGYPVMGPDSMAEELEGDLFIAIGNAELRRKLTERYDGRTFPLLIHPAAVIAGSAVIGEGTVVMAGAVVNPGTAVGKGCILNTACSVDHDCVVGDYCHISVGAHLCGTVDVGEGSWIGAGTIVSNNLNICPGVMTGAGAVVVKDIAEKGIYTGVPAKKMKKPAQG